MAGFDDGVVQPDMFTADADSQEHEGMRGKNVIFNKLVRSLEEHI